MLPKEHGQLSAKAEKALNLPEGYKLYSPFPFAGVDQLSSRSGMKDQKFYYLENILRLGDGNLRTLWGNGPAFYTAPSGKKMLPYFYWFNIGAQVYVVVFFTDGSAVQVAYPSGAVTTISNATNTFYDPSLSTQLPVCSQWGSQYLLIANNFSQNCYWIWDGTLLYTNGTLGPFVDIVNPGSGYTSAPSIVAYGGSGTGATFVGTVSAGNLVNIQVTNPGTGYEADDQPQLYISGGGTDSGIELTASLTAGAVGSVVVTAGGSSYDSSTSVTINAVSGGSGATAVAVITGGVITAINVTDGGSGYVNGATVSITDGMAGSGASAIAVLNASTVTSVTVVYGGTNLTGTPTISFLGGGGTGAVATAVVSGGAITSVTVTNGGSGYTFPPAVVAQDGLNSAAAATVSIMPFGVSGSSMETFLQRVWLPYPNEAGTAENGGRFLVSAPGSFTDFSIGDGGLIFTSSDSFLRAQYVNIRQSNGYLYPIGDSSVSVISNVQTTGTPPITTFNYQNTDPQIGAAWRDSCALFSKTITFMNPFGFFGLYGGSVTKISSDIDRIFENAIFPPTAGAVTPSSAVANIYNRKILLGLMTVNDILAPGTYRTVLLAWDEKDWVVASQNIALTFIATQEISSDLTAWGTDGASLYPLFQTPDPTLKKALITKLYGLDAAIIVKHALGWYMQATDNSSNSAGVSLTTATTDTELGSYALPNPVAFASTRPIYTMWATSAGDVFGCQLGMSFTSLSPDFTIIYMSVGYVYWEGLFGNNPIAGVSE